ncbi:MAG: hypothetical protein II955_06155 [Clostridia bacterium]|nr:hypothetical protein [Clostridia bacterium]
MNTELYQYYVIDRVHRGLRSDWKEDLAGAYSAMGFSPEERMVRRFEAACRKETPVIHQLEQIAMRRTLRKLPDGGRFRCANQR